jgi:hypothetical protein
MISPAGTKSCCRRSTANRYACSAVLRVACASPCRPNSSHRHTIRSSGWLLVGGEASVIAGSRAQVSAVIDPTPGTVRNRRSCSRSIGSRSSELTKSYSSFAGRCHQQVLRWARGGSLVARTVRRRTGGRFITSQEGADRAACAEFSPVAALVVLMTKSAGVYRTPMASNANCCEQGLMHIEPTNVAVRFDTL